ncbi:class I SAM-dependent methyltransferase [Rhodothermus marinus]|uniref:class I SAM-dependent methyltransferase n=1 Tax=Rhodothermus marinus TaxID=29549 RepID=UPI0012BA37F3|nr:class I SAM-dependent methyltransferase [Rhodothermus marinus]BBM70634.1 hypothetical protein RmaAA213_24800 [Rhodothermus marinus]BBM73620.1 hypothetical protein RmaAA338_24850 [Rhodothermus marinus]
MRKNDRQRWQLAQRYERDWWQHVADRTDLRYYRTYAEDLIRRIAPFFTIQQDTRILEVGSGAAGIVTHLPSGYRHAIDPLEDFFRSVEKFRKYRDPQVVYHRGMGEALPFESESFDLVIMDNVLDHCQDPVQVIAEIHRVLVPGGCFYFRQNIYHRWGKFVRFWIELLRIDKGHPYTFSLRDIHTLVGRAGFEVLLCERRGYWTAWKRDLSSRRLKDKAKALLLISRDVVTLFLQKRVP